MAISFLGYSSRAYGSKQIGDVYQPKSRMSVGTDLMANTSSAMVSDGTREVTVGAGDDVKFDSMKLFSKAKKSAQNGGPVFNFRLGDTGVANKNEKHAGNLQQNDKYIVSMSNDGYLNVHHKNDKGEIDRDRPPALSQKINGDSRLTWDENNEPVLLQGSGALTGGKLKSLGDNEVLIRNSGADVEGGSGTTVYNLSKQSGSFSGGSNVTFLGSYASGSTFAGSLGATYAGYFDDAQISASGGSVFKGVFEGTKIDADDSGHVFSGFFGKSENGDGEWLAGSETGEDEGEVVNASVINGGNGENLFSGMFVDKTTVNGGDDEDRFYGRYIDSKVNGGAGRDSFGGNIDLNNLRKITDAVTGDVYMGLESDFIDSDVDAGEGDDQFNAVATGGSINMGDGDDRVRGVFTYSTVNGGAGNDDISAMYSNLSSFQTGAGNDKVNLATAIGSNVNAGEGTNKITLGHNLEQGSDALYQDGTLGAARSGTNWRSKSEYFNKKRANDHGELKGNHVNAEVGENNVRINSGEASHVVKAGDRPLDPAAPAADKKDEAAQTAESPVANPDLTAKIAEAFAAGSQGILNVATGLAGNEPAEDEAGNQPAKGDQKVERYSELSGDPLLKEGLTVATVDTGEKEDLVFRGMERQLGRNDQEKERREFPLGDSVGMYRATRRGNPFGAYDVLKFNR